jgi:hypothetical protein
MILASGQRGGASFETHAVVLHRMRTIGCCTIGAWQ